MAKVAVRAGAQADLDHIYDWSAEQFGVRVADGYLRGISACFDLLGNYPLAGRTRDDILPGLRSHAHSRHVIFYVVSEDQVAIARVMHGAQDTRIDDFT